MGKKIRFEENNSYIPFDDKNSSNDIFKNFCDRIASQDRFSGWGGLNLKSEHMPEKILFPIRIISKFAKDIISCQTDGNGDPVVYNDFKQFLRKEVCPRIKGYVKLEEDRDPILIELCHEEHAKSCEKLQNNNLPINETPRLMFKGLKVKPDGTIYLLSDDSTHTEYQLYNPPISDEIISGISKRFRYENMTVPKWHPISAKTLSDLTLDHFIPIHFMLIRKYAISICGGGNIINWQDDKLIDRNDQFTLVDLSDYLFYIAKQQLSKRSSVKANPFKAKKFSKFIEQLTDDQTELLKRICNDVASSFTDENMRKAYFAFQLMQGNLNYVKGNS